MGKITLQQVADQSGVSFATASRIMSDRTYMHSPDTVEKVKKVAEEWDTAPTFWAEASRPEKQDQSAF